MAKLKNSLLLSTLLALNFTFTFIQPAFALSEEVSKLRLEGKDSLQAGKYTEAIDSLKKAYFQSGRDDLLAKDLAEAFFARAKTHENSPAEMLDDICIATFYDNDSRHIVLLKGKAISRLYGSDWDKQSLAAKKALEDNKPEVAIVLATELIYAQGASEADSKDTLQAALKKLELKVWPKNWDREKIDYSHYMNTVSTWLRGAWAPPSAGKSSRVEVVFNIKRNGDIKNLKVKQSADNAVTDKAAMDAVRLAEPFRPFEKGWPEEVTIEFNFDYNQHATVAEANRDKYVKNTLDGIKILEEAKRASKRKDFDEAIKKYEEAIEVSTTKSKAFMVGKLVDALINQGSKLMAKDDGDVPLDDVLKCYMRAFTLDSDYWLLKEKIDIALTKSGSSTSLDTMKQFYSKIANDPDKEDKQAAAGANRWISEHEK
jgi:TonB family protein